jgi:hypothetical protein
MSTLLSNFGGSFSLEVMTSWGNCSEISALVRHVQAARLWESFGKEYRLERPENSFSLGYLRFP